MSDCPGIGVYLVIVASSKAFISEEMDGLVVSTRDLLLSRHMLQTVGFVPASWENVKRDLATDRVAANVSRSIKQLKEMKPTSSHNQGTSSSRTQPDSF